MDLTVLSILIAKCCFLSIFNVQIWIWKSLKIWKSKMAAARDVIYVAVAAMKNN